VLITEEGITTTVQDEEQFSEQVPYDQMTESPMLIDQEDQQVKGEHPQKEIFPSIDILRAQEEEEEKNLQGTIEHITQAHIPSTEKPEKQLEEQPEEQTALTEEIGTTTVEEEFTPSHEHVTETSPEITSEEAETKVPFKTTKPEAPTTIQEAEESLVTEVPATELLETSSVTESLPEEEMLTTEHAAKEHVSTEENIIEKEQSTPAIAEKGQSIEPSVSETTQTESSIKEEEATSPHEELSTQIQEETTKVEKITEEEEQASVTKASERPEISTEIIEKTTLPIEKPATSTVSESVSEQPKAGEGKPEIIPGEPLATETESSKEEETVTVVHEISSTEQIVTEKENISYSPETVVTEEVELTEASGPSKEQTVEEQKPIASEDEKEQQPEETTSEHAILEEQATVGAKKEDAGLTESSVMSEEPVITEEPHAEEESTPEIPAKGPTGIPIPERSPGQKAEDENVYHVTEDYHGVTYPEISPDNLITESPQKIPTTHLPQEQEITLTPSEETTKPIATEGIEILMEETTKPTLEETTINLSAQHKPEITTISEETKTQSTPPVTEVQTSTEFSTTTITQKVPEEEAPEKSIVPEETTTKVSQIEIQLTEKTSSGEEMPTKELNVEKSDESSSGEVSGKKDEKEVQPKKEEETQPSIITKAEIAPETSTFIPVEHSTVPSDLAEEHTTEGEYISTVIPSVEQESTHVPLIEKKETEKVPIEKEEPTEKPEERITEHPNITTGKEKELQTEEPVLKEEQTTEAIKTIEAEEKPTTQAVKEEITERPEQYSTEKTLEEGVITESHGLEETEGTKGISTESAEQQTSITITEKEPFEETVELKPTEITGIEQTELPTEYPIEAGEIKKEGEEKISVPVSTMEVQTEIPAIETAATETTVVETEKMQTESSGEYIPSQPSIPSDRKEDQEFVEPQLHEEQLTQKPEKEITETYDELQKPTVSEEKTSHIPFLEGAITESVLPKEKSTESSTTESVAVTSEQPELSSEQPEKITTEPFKQEEQTQEPITEVQPEIHEGKEIETSSPAIHEESSIIPEVPERPVEDVDVDKTTKTVESESTTVSALISEASTELPAFEESTKHEVPIEKEITPATESLEKEQPEIQEQTTQPSIKEEIPITGVSPAETEGPTEISTEESVTSETPKVPITKEQLPKSEEEKVVQKTEIPEHEEKEEYSTVAPKETPEMKITTTIPSKEVPQYTTDTSILEETSIEGESTSEIAPRPSGIPGEGNCLIEGQSYSNNSVVPPANACQTSCRCISSIVQCELVKCPAPTVHLPNCMPVYTNSESCCPMYACDSTPTAELESDSHVIKPHISEAEEEIQKIVPSTEIPTEVATESSTLTGEIIEPVSTPKLPVEITVPSITPSEEAITTERQQTTLKHVETVYEQPTTVGQPIEQYPEEHTISSIPKTSHEATSQLPKEEHTVSPIISEETTEGKVSEEGITKSTVLIEQPEEIGEKQIPVSGEVITSTHIPMEQESHGTEETVTISTVTKETSVPVEVEEISTLAEREEEVTIITVGKEETTISSKEQEKPIEEKGIEEQSTLKPIEGIEKEQPEEEKVSLKPISEKPIAEEYETSTKPEEIVTEKSEIPMEQKTVKPIYESTSVPEIQPTTEYKPESETEKEEKGHETVTLTETVQTEEPENQTKLPDIVPSKVETREPIIPAESTTLIHDHTVSEEAPTEEYTTIKSTEISTEESIKTEPKISTQTPTTEEEEHVTIAVLPVETEIPSEETTKPIEESTSEVSHEKTPETTESVIEKETTEYAEKQEPSITEHEEEPFVTKSPEEPSETVSPVNIEEPVKTDKTTEMEHEKSTETSVAHEPESTQVSVEKNLETTSEIETHTSELPAEEYTKEVSTTSAPAEKEAGEQTTISIVKEIEPSLSEAETKQPVIPESEIPVAEDVTVAIVEQTPKSEEYPVEEQTVASPSSSEEKITEGGITTEVVTETSQEEQATEKILENDKPETQSPSLAEEHTITSEIYKKDEEQKPEIGITKEPAKEEPTTISETSKKEIEEAVKEEAVTSTTEEHIKQEEIEPIIKIHGPIETTTVPEEQTSEKEGTEVSLTDHSVSEETTVVSLISEEHSIVPEKTEEKQSTHEPEYQTTLSIAEEISKPTTEISEVEKLSPEQEIATVESTEKPEESVTKVEESSTEKPQEVSFETETQLPEQGETTTKAIESAATKEILPEEVVTEEVIPKVEEKPTEASVAEGEEKVHSTEPTYSLETTSIREEEQPSITTLQPTERPLLSEEKTPAEEIPSQSEKGEEAHPTIPEEGHPDITKEPQFTTEPAPEEFITIKTEEHPEIKHPETSSEAVATVEGPIKVSGTPEMSTELPEETTSVEPVIPEEHAAQIPIKSEESPQPEIEEPDIKTQPISTELPIGEITEEIPEDHIHVDHFPETTVKPETDYSFQQSATTLAPHIPEYPDQTGISGDDNTHFPMPGGYPNPDDDYGEDDYGGPGTCRYGGKVYVSAQQIPRDDPCDFCFCFRSDIICLQQSCPPPIPGCHEEPISGFCCPRYECPVSMATALNLTTTTTTTTTTLPPHFHAHAYKGAARRSGCQVRGQAYRVGEVIKSASGPCLRCM